MTCNLVYVKTTILYFRFFKIEKINFVKRFNNSNNYFNYFNNNARCFYLKRQFRFVL